MSKFLNLCEKVEKFLKEQDGIPEFSDQTQQPSPGEPVDGPIPTIDPETDSQVKDVDNTKIEKLIETIVDFYQKGRALSADSVNDINRLPSKINSENSEKVVEQLIQIFNKSDLPEDTSELNA